MVDDTLKRDMDAATQAELDRLEKAKQTQIASSVPGPNYNGQLGIPGSSTANPYNIDNYQPDYSAVPANAQLPAPQLGLAPMTPPQGPPANYLPTTPPSVPVAIPGAPPGAIHATPQQATSDYLQHLQTREDLQNATGNEESAGQQQVANIMGADAAEKANQAADYQNFQATAAQRQKRFADQGQNAFNDLQAAAKESGKDPTEQFWADRGTPRRILSGLAAFASGLGSGLLGKGGNPYLDFLNSEIGRNFDAHKQHINDLYNDTVAAGHLQDTDQNRQQFENQAKLGYYQLASAHVIPQLQQVAAQTNSSTVKLAAQNAISGMQDQETTLRAGLTHNEAMQNAANAALLRAQQKEAREYLDKAQERYKDDPIHGPQRALQDTINAGFPRAIIASIAAASGIPYDSATGQYRGDLQQIPGSTYDQTTGKWSVPAVPDAEGNLIPPHAGAVFNKESDTWTYSGTANDKPLQPRGSAANQAAGSTSYDPTTGKAYTPEQRAAQQALVVQTPEGPRLANSKEDADDARLMSSATNDLENSVKRLKDIEATLAKAGAPNTPAKLEQRRQLVKEYEGRVADMVVRYNAAANGVKRATGMGETRILGSESMPTPPASFYGGTVPEAITGRATGNKGNFDALDEIIKSNRDAVKGYLQPPAKIVPQPGAPKNQSQAEIDDMIERAGGKKVK